MGEATQGLQSLSTSELKAALRPTPDSPFPDMDLFDESKYANQDPNSNLAVRDVIRLLNYAGKLGFVFHGFIGPMSVDDWIAAGGDLTTPVEAYLVADVDFELKEVQYNAKRIAMVVQRYFQRSRNKGWDCFKEFYVMSRPGKFATDAEILGALLQLRPTLAEGLFKELNDISL